MELETTDTAEVKSTNALVDYGATREFIDQHYAKSSWCHLLKLSKLSLPSPTSENRSSFSDTLGSVNIIWKSTRKPEKSRCLTVHLTAALVVKKMLSKSGLPIKLRSIEKRPVPVVQYLNSIMMWMTLKILTTMQNV